MSGVDPNDSSVVSIQDARPSRASANSGKRAGATRHSQTMRFMIEQITAGQLANVDKALRELLNGRPPVRDMVTGAILDPGQRPNPKAYLDALTGLFDFSLPRLTRVEVKGAPETPEDVQISATATAEEAQLAYLRLVNGSTGAA